jgi:transposase-like protein
MSRQQYTPEFKRRALELLAESGKSVALQQGVKSLRSHPQALESHRLLLIHCKHYSQVQDV